MRFDKSSRIFNGTVLCVSLDFLFILFIYLFFWNAEDKFLSYEAPQKWSTHTVKSLKPRNYMYSVLVCRRALSEIADHLKIRDVYDDETKNIPHFLFTPWCS
jgi:hypothetical protein